MVLCQVIGYFNNMKSLKISLNELIEKQSYLSLDQAYAFGATLKAKNKTVERQLNPSRSPNVFTVKNERGQIVGYRWLGTSNTAPVSKLIETMKMTTEDFVCCISYSFFKVHSGDCPVKIKEKSKTLF